MKKAYFIYLNDKRNYPICKRLESMGYEIIGIDLYSKMFLDSNKRLKLIKDQKIISIEENEELNKHDKTFVEDKTYKYFKSKNIIQVEDLKLDEDDRVFCFNEFELFESTILDNKNMRPKNALSYIAKHIYYRKLNIEYTKIYSYKDLIRASKKYKRMILKPSICSMGKRNIHILNTEIEIDNFIKKYPNIFNGRLFMGMEYINYVDELWAFTLFDANGTPYILFFMTKNGHTTFSPFERDVYDQIKNINAKLDIKNWMACIQFLILPNGEIQFIDLNPRLPADDDWYELAYRYLTGKRLSKVILNLILNGKAPYIIKTNRVILEKEYDPSKGLQRNQKTWEYTDMYKEKPLLEFKKLDLYSNN